MTKRNLSSRLLAAHAIATYLFLYGPIVILVLFSFSRSKYVSSWEGFSLRWYAALWQDEQMQECIRTSLVVGLVATVIATAAGTLAAVAMSRGKFRGAAATGALLYLPIITPEIVVGAALLTFFALTRWGLGLWAIVAAHVAFSI